MFPDVFGMCGFKDAAGTGDRERKVEGDTKG